MACIEHTLRHNTWAELFSTEIGMYQIGLASVFLYCIYENINPNLHHIICSQIHKKGRDKERKKKNRKTFVKWICVGESKVLYVWICETQFIINVSFVAFLRPSTSCQWKFTVVVPVPWQIIWLFNVEIVLKHNLLNSGPLVTVQILSYLPSASWLHILKIMLWREWHLLGYSN